MVVIELETAKFRKESDYPAFVFIFFFLVYAFLTFFFTFDTERRGRKKYANAPR